MSPLLTQVLAVHRTLATVRTIRRVLLSVAAGLVCELLVRVIAGVGSAARMTPVAGVSGTSGVLLGVIVVVVMWAMLGRRGQGGRLTDTEALARTALWIEEQGAPATAAPDFALTTAVEMLATGAAISSALSTAAGRTVREAPIAAALRRTRRAAWQWPGLFVAGCALLLLMAHGRQPVARDVLAGDPAAATGDRQAGNTVPLEPWTVLVVPPAYTALPATSYGNATSVAALIGSRVTVRGNGAAPRAVVGTVGSVDTVLTPVREHDGGWEFSTVAGTPPQRARVSRGGSTRLLFIEGRADSVPRVSLALPARDSVFREARGALPLAATVDDDIGLARAHFELIVTSGQGERFTVRTVHLNERTWPARARTRRAALRGELDLAKLGLQPGDVVHLRAVGRDGHPAAYREFGTSETRAFRIARTTEYDSVAVEPAPPPEVDKSLLSQRMLLLLTEKLDKAQKRMVRSDVLRESLALARDQARLRLAVGDVVFQRLSGESSAEHAHSAGDGHDHGVALQGGKLAINTSSTTGMLEEGNDSPVVAINQPLLEAYNAMWDAGRALEQGDPHAAIPPMKRALEAIERSRAASRIYLRSKPPQVIVDIGKVRLTGRDTGQVTVRSSRTALDVRSAERDARLVRAAGLLAANLLAARDSVALLRVEALGDAPGFAALLTQLLAAIDRGGDVTDPVVQARRVLGNVARTRTTVWSRGVPP